MKPWKLVTAGTAITGLALGAVGGLTTTAEPVDPIGLTTGTERALLDDRGDDDVRRRTSLDRMIVSADSPDGPSADAPTGTSDDSPDSPDRASAGVVDSPGVADSPEVADSPDSPDPVQAPAPAPPPAAAPPPPAPAPDSPDSPDSPDHSSPQSADSPDSA